MGNRLNANRNHWTPLEISMAQDVHDYHHKLTPAERHVFENVLAYLTTSDTLAMRNSRRIWLSCHTENANALKPKRIALPGRIILNAASIRATKRD